MKKNIIIILVSIFLLSLPAFAADNKVYQLQQSQELLFDQEEYQQVMANIKSSVLLSSIDETKQGSRFSLSETASSQQRNAYKVYSLVREDLLASVASGIAISDLISDNYEWLVTDEDENIVYVKKVNNEWVPYMISSPTASTIASKVVQSKVVQYSTIAEHVTNISIKQTAMSSQIEELNTTSAQCFYSKVYRTYFVYITDGVTDYLVPFSSRPDFTKLENGKLYSLQEVCKILSESGFDEEISATKDQKFGGIKLRNVNAEAERPISISTFTIFTIVIWATSAWLLTKKNKSN